MWLKLLDRLNLITGTLSDFVLKYPRRLVCYIYELCCVARLRGACWAESPGLGTRLGLQVGLNYPTIMRGTIGVTDETDNLTT